MDQETASALLAEAVSGKSPKPCGMRRRKRRPLVRICLVLLTLLGIVAGGVVWRLTEGPWRIEGLSEQVSAGIAGSIGPGWRVELADSALELDSEHSLALRVDGLDVYNPAGALVVRAPMALVSLDIWELLRLSVQPRSIEFRDIQMTALIHDDGSIAFAASSPSQAAKAKPHTLPSVDPARGAVSPVSAAVASIFGVVLDSAGVVGALDRARIRNGRLTLIDDQAIERAVFERVNGLFRRDHQRQARIFELRIDGPNGEWRFGGDVHEEGGAKRAGTITLDDLPITDLLLLSGHSALPVDTDLKLSAKADVTLEGGRIEKMKGEIRTSAGNLLIDEKDFNPVTVENLRAEVSWNEPARTMSLDTLDYEGAGNKVRLSGALALGSPRSDTPWSFRLGGRDAVLRGAGPKDAPVKIDEIAAQLSGRTGGIAIDELTLKGAGLDGKLSGTIGTGEDEEGLTLHILAANSEGRTIMRLWPEHIAPAVRNYLVDYLRGGQLDSADIHVDMSADEVASATKGDPLADHAIHIDFAVSNATLTISQDAPPLSQGRVAGTITGRSTTIKNTTAEIRMPENWGSLALTDGSFLIRDPQPERVIAQIGLRLGGGADTLAVLLQTKMFKGLTGADIDASTVKGRADLRIDFPLNLKEVPDLADMPITLTGTLADLTLDKAFGKDRFEAGKFALSYDRSGFALKGEGRVLGAATTIDLKQAKPGVPGEALVGVVIDETFRTKRGLPVAPQLSGPIAARFTVPIGGKEKGKPPIRVEADLARVGVDGILPGWTKAPGKAGRLNFTLIDTPGDAIELRDIALDSAPASARGNATISAEGAIDRAEFTSLKLSPGDDMRVSLDRAGHTYKIAVRGAVADARPFLKALTGDDGKSSKAGSPKDIEADVALNIITGFNGESLTGASLKLAMKDSDVRSAQMRGKFGGASFTAAIGKGDRGLPYLSLASADSGSTLRFLDVYKRMYGGGLQLGIYLNDGPQTGIVKIENFTLRDEPALSRIVAQSNEATDARGRRVQQATNVEFDRMRANFTRNGSRISFSNASISNTAMGFTLGGWLDSVKERAQIDGTFVPLYGLNNAVTMVPLVGPLIAGGRNEGLFGVNFSVSGSLKQPSVSVNPLSAVAPGFLRKLFGAGGGEAFALGAVVE